MAKRKASLGRQKISLEKISKKNHLQVTFSKRRAGLFKKASELCTLCGVEVAIIVFSPADKAFSFGHPNVDSLVDRFLGHSSAQPPCSNTHHFIESLRKANVRELNLQLNQVLGQLEFERKRGETMTQATKASQSQCWWESPIEELSYMELGQLKDALEEIKKNMAIFAESAGSSSSFQLVGPNHSNPGIEHAGSFGSKLNEATTTDPCTINPHFHNFGYGHGSF